jgi:hypothetical protein
MTTRLYPTPAEFAASPQVYRHFKHVRDSWMIMVRYLSIPLTTPCGFFHENLIREDPSCWAFDVARVSTETPEGEAIHLLYYIHSTDPEKQPDMHVLAYAQHRFLALRKEHNHRWGEIPIAA